MRPPPALRYWSDLELALLRRTPAPRAVFALVGANALAFVLLAASPESAAQAWGADRSLLAGEWWRALTAAFVHMNLWHLGVNLTLLVLFGLRSERAYG